MKEVVLTVLILLGHAVSLRISNNLPMNSGLPSNKPSLSNLWPPPPNSNLQCQCTCEPSSNPGNHIYVSGDINIESSHAQTTYTPDVSTTSFVTQTPVVLNNVEITHKRPVTDPSLQEQALATMTTTSAPSRNAPPEPGKTARAGAKPLSKGLQLRDRLKERRNRRIMLEQLNSRSNPAGIQKSVGTKYGIPLKDSLKGIPETTTDRNSETGTEIITTISPMTGNNPVNRNDTGSNIGSSDGQSSRNGKGNGEIANGGQNGNSIRNGNSEGNRNSNSRINGKTNGSGNTRPTAGNKNKKKSGEQNAHDSNGEPGTKTNGSLKQDDSRKQINNNNNGNNSNNGSATYIHVDGSGSNVRNESVSAKDKMIIDLLQKLSSQTANNNNNNNNANSNNNNNAGGRMSDRWHGGQANTGWNKAPSTYPTTTAAGFGFGIGFGMPPMMGMGMGEWIPSF